MSGHEVEPCEAYRQRAFDYRRGDLQGAEEEDFEEHVKECEACRDFVNRIDILIGAAQEREVAGEPDDPDAMFADIAGQIEVRAAATDETSDDGSSDPGGPDDSPEQLHPPSRSGYVGWVAAAAAVALVVGVWAIFFGSNDRSEPSGMRADEAGESTEKTTDDTPDEASRRPARFAALRSVVSESSNPDAGAAQLPEGVEIFASSEADWSIRGDGELTLELRAGEMLVEFVPSGGKELSVEAPGYRVRVVGTVFYVSARENEPPVGVLEGAVDVASGEGRTVRVESRQEMGANFEPRPMAEERREQLEDYVDLEAHRRKLAAAADSKAADSKAADQEAPGEREQADGPPEESEVGNAKAQRPEERPPEEAPGPDRDPLEQLREEADRAATDGQFGRAEDRYEAFLDRAPPDHPAVGPVHLDLANLYIHRLDQPRRAVSHLKTFVRRWPDDVAADSARDTLCRLTRELDGFEPQCP